MKTCSNLIFIGFLLSILFGQGIHYHTIVDHLFDHGDIHLVVHSHRESDDHKRDHGSSFNLEDTHQHPISTLSLKSVRVTTDHTNLDQISIYFVGNILDDPELIEDDLHPSYLDLPPPGQITDLSYRLSFSLRAPPVG